MRHECPVVAVTAFTDISVKEKALKLGMSALINKPVSFHHLKEVVERFYF
jgi:FixJ family two-component response regulator